MSYLREENKGIIESFLKNSEKYKDVAALEEAYKKVTDALLSLSVFAFLNMELPEDIEENFVYEDAANDHYLYHKHLLEQQS